MKARRSVRLARNYEREMIDSVKNNSGTRILTSLSEFEKSLLHYAEIFRLLTISGAEFPLVSRAVSSSLQVISEQLSKWLDGVEAGGSGNPRGNSL